MASKKHQSYTHGEIIEDVDRLAEEIDELKSIVNGLVHGTGGQQTELALADARAIGFALLSLIVGVVALTVATSNPISNRDALIMEAGILASLVVILATSIIEIARRTGELVKGMRNRKKP